MDPEMILQQRCRCLVTWTARRLLSSGVSEAGTEMRGSTFSLSADFPQPSTSTYHDVMVLHPHVRWGSSSASALKDPKLQLQEAASLVNTLPGFRVVGSQIIGVDYSTKRKAIWGAGKIEELLREKEEMGYSALMVNVQMLAPMQQRELHSLFRVPIFDRYNIVLSIFKHYARTEEAHLQILLAELPYIRQRLHYLNRARTTADILQIEKDDLKSSPDQLEALRLREQQLKKRLKEAVEKRTKEMTTTAKMAPQIAVVGYTNAGKTSLVKRLTGAEGLKPEDRLFATLDSTSHTAKLPSGRAASFVDTVGFLSDLPTQLFAAFETTLAHVKHADVILHLRDMSHPHWPAQSEDVVRTLESIGLTEQDFDRVVTVDNKIDRCHDYTEPENAIGISCQTGQGLEKLIKLVDARVLQSLDCRPRRFRLNFSSPLISYLYREGLVIREPKVEEDSLVFDVFMTEAEMAQLKKRSVALKKK